MADFNKRVLLFYVALILLLSACTESRPQKQILAQTPPMGWNSWICYGTSVTEAEVRANADFMAEFLKPHGWEYVIIDAGWYAPGMVTLEQYESEHPHQLIDEYGRLIIDTEKYPSALDGNGLKSLSDYVHSKGLKLGIHIMRGIPVQAYEHNTPVKGTGYTARDIADPDSHCEWYRGFYGIDMSKPGAQEYYDSIFELYESWGIDYVKADDLLSPVYAYDEIDAISKAVAKLDNPPVLSLSPGPAPVENVRHMDSVSQLWRISEDFWDNWESLKKQFPLCRKWQSYGHPGGWPDADMLPVGPMALRAMRGEPRMTAFTEDEQYTMMTLWAMFRSPLMLGCSLPDMDPFTLSLVTNDDVIAINQHSVDNRELYEKDGVIVWYARSETGNEHYVAVFNTTDAGIGKYDFNLNYIGIDDAVSVMDVWSGTEVDEDGGVISFNVNSHGTRLLKIKI